MKNTEIIANNLNKAFEELLFTPSFIYTKNWNFFSNVVSESKMNGISFQINSSNFYDLTTANPLEDSIGIYSQLDEIQIKKDIIVQSQNYDLAAKLKDEENVLIEKLRLLNFNDTTTEILFFTPIKKSVIEVKQFQNKLFNKMFLKYLNFNI
jgi:hypothetical protein